MEKRKYSDSILFKQKESSEYRLEMIYREEEEEHTSLNRWIASDDLLPKKFPIY